MIEQIERMYRRFLMLVRSGKATLVNDAAPTQQMQITLSQVEVLDGVLRIAEYGFQSVPPAGADVVAVFPGGNLSDGVVIATGHQTYRLRSLATGEVAISDDKGQRVYLSAAGIRIEGAALPVQINTTGGLTVNADTTFNGSVYANGKRIDNLHHHVPDSRGDTQGIVA